MYEAEMFDKIERFMGQKLFDEVERNLRGRNVFIRQKHIYEVEIL